MLQRDNIVSPVVQNIRRVGIILDRLVANLQPDLRRIAVGRGVAVVGHRDDAGFNVGIQRCDSLSQDRS